LRLVALQKHVAKSFGGMMRAKHNLFLMVTSITNSLGKIAEMLQYVEDRISRIVPKRFRLTAC
jgi:hypothetical protein